jgi:membrane associated rhomboid family serine protease
MFLPVGDRPNPENYTPWVNYGLMATNVLVFGLISLPLTVLGADLSDPMLQAWVETLLQAQPGDLSLDALENQLTAYDVFVAKHGYKPGAPEVSDVFACLFLHANFAHLAGNMLFLWIYGDNVEHRLGRAGYLCVYLLSGVAASLFFGAISGDSLTPLIGASGAISGVLGLYFFLFPANEIKIFIFLIPFIFKSVFFKARWVLLFYVVVENLFPLWLGAGSSTAYGAHLGGFFFGLLAGLIASLVVARPKARGDLSRAQFHLKMARYRLQQGQPVSAYQHVNKALKQDPSVQLEADEILSQIPS